MAVKLAQAIAGWLPNEYNSAIALFVTKTEI